MEQLVIGIILTIFGVAIGSFGGAMVWRLRARQLREDRAAGEKVDAKEYDSLKKLLRNSVAQDRSQCLHCHHQLAWYDLVPLISWMWLRGKCRYCHKPIGVMEPLIEIGTAGFILVSYFAWPIPLDTALSIAQFGLWLCVGVGLIVLFAYDSRWFLLPDKLVFPLIALSFVSAILTIIEASDRLSTAISLGVALFILSGLYYCLYIFSKGAWIGFGDIKLGIVLALMLADWRLAFLTLFLANFIGLLIVMPGLLMKRISRNSHVPFGPMLITAFFIVGLFGQSIIQWYFSSLSLY